MRFAPPQAMRVEGRGGGLNQTSVRTYNERLIMSLLRQHGSLSRMELGQWSGLSAQTVSVIVRALDRDNLVLPGEVQRGRVGPPSTPILLNPEGAFSIGVSVSPRTADVVLIDFNGVIRLQRTISGEARVPSGTLEGIVSTVAEFAAGSAPPWRNRIVGVGVSLPEDVPFLERQRNDNVRILDRGCGRSVDCESNRAADIHPKRCDRRRRGGGHIRRGSRYWGFRLPFCRWSDGVQARS